MRQPALVLVAVIACSTCARGTEYQPRNGDIIFHTSRSSQSIAIQKATNSPYSHMGIVYLKDAQPYVFEAVEPVKSTPLDEWTARGVRGEFVVKRLRNDGEVLTPDALARMKEVGEAFRGKHYDLYFEWSDDRVYCSELVWKIYERALGIEIGNLETIREFDLSDPVVQAKVHERWGGEPPPDEIVISPEAILSSELLVTVAE